jgi:hypothetical protein
MLLVKKIHLYVIFFIVFLIILGFGINGYLVFSRLEPGPGLSAKFQAENFIYLIILATLILICLLIYLQLRSRNVFKELDKIIELSKVGSYSVGDHSRKLGDLGRKIDEINSRLEILNEMKSLKISTLYNLNNFIIDQINSDFSAISMSMKKQSKANIWSRLLRIWIFLLWLVN